MLYSFLDYNLFVEITGEYLPFLSALGLELYGSCGLIYAAVGKR